MRALLVFLVLGMGSTMHARADHAWIAAQDAWLEEGQAATIDLVHGQLAQSFQPAAPRAVHPLSPQRTLWIRLRLPPSDQPLAIEVPVPLIDLVTLYQRKAGGGWAVQTAGDHRAVASWSRPGRYPAFDLAPWVGPREVFLRIRHSDPIGFALKVGPASELDQDRQSDYLLLGMLLGSLALLTASCAVQSALYRDANMGWYAAYAAAMTLTMATITGVTAHLLWNESPRWADAAQGCLPVTLAGVHVLFLRHLCGITPRNPLIGKTALGLGALIVVLGLAYLFVGERAQSLIVSFSLLAGIVCGLGMAALSWRRHDSVGGWVLLAYTPLALAIVVALLRLQGWIAASWLTVDASATAAALAVPLLLVALNARSRDWRAVETRVNKLTQQDALTGLLSAEAFMEQLDGAVSGALMRRERAAVVLIEIANLDKVRRFHGDAMAEQCLLRAAIKLHRVIRDSDPAGRVATAQFALIFEGASSRDEVQERMVRLVSSGLIPARGAGLEIPLQFHVACLMLGEGVKTSSLILRDLGALLTRMRRRNRKPVQFLDPQKPTLDTPADQRDTEQADLVASV